MKLTSELERKFIKMRLESEVDSTSNGKSVGICVGLDKSASWTIVAYAQYWILNKTGLPLCIRVSFS